MANGSMTMGVSKVPDLPSVATDIKFTKKKRQKILKTVRKRETGSQKKTKSGLLNKKEFSQSGSTGNKQACLT